MPLERFAYVSNSEANGDPWGNGQDAGLKRGELHRGVAGGDQNEMEAGKRDVGRSRW
jgi:hypothetical protein